VLIELPKYGCALFAFGTGKGGNPSGRTARADENGDADRENDRRKGEGDLTVAREVRQALQGRQSDRDPHKSG
jgi:hypothetical protein